MKTVTTILVRTATFSVVLALILSKPTHAQLRGLTGSTPYVLPVDTRTETISLLTVDNTGAAADDVVPKFGGGSYGMVGIPDELGAYDNGNGTFTLLVNQELGSTVGAVRDHGGKAKSDYADKKYRPPREEVDKRDYDNQWSREKSKTDYRK